MGGRSIAMEINSRLLAAFGGLMLLILSIVIAGMIDIRSLMWELKGAYPLIIDRLDRQEARVAQRMDGLERRMQMLEAHYRGRNDGNP